MFLFFRDFIFSSERDTPLVHFLCAAAAACCCSATRAALADPHALTLGLHVRTGFADNHPDRRSRSSAGEEADAAGARARAADEWRALVEGAVDCALALEVTRALLPLAHDPRCAFLFLWCLLAHFLPLSLSCTCARCRCLPGAVARRPAARGVALGQRRRSWQQPPGRFRQSS